MLHLDSRQKQHFGTRSGRGTKKIIKIDSFEIRAICKQTHSMQTGTTTAMWIIGWCAEKLLSFTTLGQLTRFSSRFDWLLCNNWKELLKSTPCRIICLAYKNNFPIVCYFKCTLTKGRKENENNHNRKIRVKSRWCLMWRVRDEKKVHVLGTGRSKRSKSEWKVSKLMVTIDQFINLINWSL